MKRIFILYVVTFYPFCYSVAQNSGIDLHYLLDLIHKDSLMRTVQEMQNFEPRLCNYSMGQNKKVVQYFVDRMKSYGIENARIDSFFVSGTPYSYIVGPVYQYMYNAVGSLKGAGNTDSTVIIGAHLDAISFTGNYPNYILAPTQPGADDNASGCAVMIEMARIIHESGVKPLHNIDFMAYDAEEIGLMGSDYDAKKRLAAKENIIVMLNNDIVGYQPEHSVWTANLRWYDNSTEVTEKAEQAFLDYTSVIPFKYEGETNQRIREGSDSWSYAKRGYKALFTAEYYYNSNIHSESDLYPSLNYEFMQQIARMNFVLLFDYAGINQSPNSIAASYPFESSVDVFPNPVTHFIRVHHYSDITISQISIYDIFGKQFINITNISDSQTIIPVSTLSSGVYFVQILTNRGVINKKIIKL